MYDSPELSSYKKKLKDAGQYEETLENLDNFLTFNAWTSSATSISGNEEDIMENLENGEFLTSSYPTSKSYSTRSSMDAVFNSRGRKLIHMATSQNLKILNGAIIGEAQGAFTCATYNRTERG